MKGKTEKQAVLYRADWVVPVTSPPIRDGAVLAAEGKIVALGTHGELKKQGAATVSLDGIVIPGLINGHCHLELSHLGGCCPGNEKGAERGGFVGWVRRIVAAREAMARVESAQRERDSARTALEDGGVVLVADIGNAFDPHHRAVSASGMEVVFFLEMLGLSRRAAAKVLETVESLPLDLCCTAHGPHSTDGRLISRLKERSRRWNTPFPIHVAESAEEMEFLMSGTGAFRAFLEERDAWDGSFTPPGKGAVSYLDELGVLDEKTLCVHCVHVSEEEIDLLARRGAKVCLCPGSNQALGVGTAPVASMVRKGLLPAIGTDSLASNPRLDLWREMRIIRENHPHIKAETVFAMATLGGARALGADSRLGSLEPGKDAMMLLVPYLPGETADPHEYLATRGCAEGVTRLGGKGEAS